MGRFDSDVSKVPKYVQLAAQLRRQIVSGELRPTDRVPSFPQLRVEFGISQNTVEKAHALLEQEGLIIRRQGFGTFVAEPKLLAATGVIGFYGLNPEFRHLPYYVHLLRGVQSAAQRLGLQILLLHPDFASNRLDQVDGLLLLDPNSGSLMGGLPPGMCCVSLFYQSGQAAQVVTDDYHGMKEATEHLLGLGHRRIAYLMEDDPFTNNRRRGYEDALRAAGIEPQNSWLHPLTPHHIEEFRGRGREAMREWLATDWHELGCTALLCQNDRTAIGVLEALDGAGVHVPTDVSLVGFDSTDESDLVRPRLTSVHVPLQEIGAAGVEMLVREMAGEAAQKDGVPKAVVLPERLDIRESTAPPPQAKPGRRGRQLAGSANAGQAAQVAEAVQAAEARRS
jgi:DNA-binding LacI/PurR family transcriptional regulator